MKQAQLTVVKVGGHEIRNILCPDKKRYTVLADFQNSFYGGRKTNKAVEILTFSHKLESLGVQVDGVHCGALVIETALICQIFKTIPPVSTHSAKILVHVLANFGPDDMIPANIEVPETYAYSQKTSRFLAKRLTCFKTFMGKKRDVNGADEKHNLILNQNLTWKLIRQCLQGAVIYHYSAVNRLTVQLVI